MISSRSAKKLLGRHIVQDGITIPDFERSAQVACVELCHGSETWAKHYTKRVIKGHFDTSSPDKAYMAALLLYNLGIPENHQVIAAIRQSNPGFVYPPPQASNGSGSRLEARVAKLNDSEIRAVIPLYYGQLLQGAKERSRLFPINPKLFIGVNSSIYNETIS